MADADLKASHPEAAQTTHAHSGVNPRHGGNPPSASTEEAPPVCPLSQMMLALWRAGDTLEGVEFVIEDLGEMLDDPGHYRAQILLIMLGATLKQVRKAVQSAAGEAEDLELSQRLASKGAAA